VLGIIKKMAPVATAIVLLVGCASAPKLPNSQTASEQYSTLGYHEKFVARNFYDLGSGDAIKRLYWAQRRAQEQGRNTVEASPVEKLQRRYVNIPYPPFQDADGTMREGGVRAVEIVQIWKAVPSHGRKLFLVK
jgi:hypothetical protein